MKLGFIGTGTIAKAIVEGLQASPASCPIVLSPRNAVVAAQLAARYKNVQVAESNQAVLDATDTVIVAVRPQVVHEVLSSLHFRPAHQVISLVPSVSLEYLRSTTTPAGRVTRCVPLPSAAFRQSPVAMYPPNPEVKAMFDQLGMSITLDNEEEFDAFTTATAIMSSYFGFAHTTSAWMENHGVPRAKARAYVGQMLRGLAATTEVAAERSFTELVEEHQTRGGLNEQVFRAVAPDGTFADLWHALDGVMARLKVGKAQRESETSPS